MLSASSGKILYQVVREAMNRLEIEVNENDERSVLVWFDTIKDIDYFSHLQPWQVVNRIPNVNVICRKALFVRTIHRIAHFFPHLYTFLPRSYILPHHREKFEKAVQQNKKKYIVKPDGGALGAGITIIEPGDTFVNTYHLAIAQEYIESYLLNNFKFDLRVYVLVIPQKKPRIYVYRNGIARFCSMPVGDGSPYSQLTNTAVNMKNPTTNASAITRTIESVFQQIKQNGGNIDKLWRDIDDAVGLTVLASSGFITTGSNIKTPNYGYPRCFQLLGFDVLLGRDMKPWIMEVNYRPSLEFDTEQEKNLKIDMLSDLMSIAAPYGFIEQAVRSKTKDWSYGAWRTYLTRHHDIPLHVKSNRKAALQKTKFVKVYPSKLEERSEWENVLAASNSMPTDLGNGYQLPRLVESLPLLSSPQQKAKPIPIVSKPVPTNKLYQSANLPPLVR